MTKGLKIRNGDNVVVIGGKDAGKTGKVIRVEPSKRRLYVEGLNMVKRHQRPRSVKDAQKGGQVGGVIDKEAPIHVSNVMIADPKDGQPTRVRLQRRDGKRVRIAARSGQELD